MDGPSQTSSGTDDKSALPVSANMTSTGGYGAPTPLQIRGLSTNATASHNATKTHANATTSAKPTQTGGAEQKTASVVALLCGLMVAAYLF
jgi:hypothetical protein